MAPSDRFDGHDVPAEEDREPADHADPKARMEMRQIRAKSAAMHSRTRGAGPRLARPDGSCCFGCGLCRERLADSRRVLMWGGGAATPKGAGLTGNYSPAVWSGTAAVGTFESKRFG